MEKDGRIDREALEENKEIKANSSQVRIQTPNNNYSQFDYFSMN